MPKRVVPWRVRIDTFGPCPRGSDDVARFAAVPQYEGMVLLTCAEKSLRRKTWVAKLGATLSTLAYHRIDIVPNAM